MLKIPLQQMSDKHAKINTQMMSLLSFFSSSFKLCFANGQLMFFKQTFSLGFKQQKKGQN